VKNSILLLCAVFFLNGCVAAAVGGFAYVSAEKREARQKFMEDFNYTNLEREKAGLDPLDICDAKRQFEPDWAYEDRACRFN